jgi:alpha-L-fucosidase 2
MLLSTITYSQVLPTISTTNNEVWYYMKFETGGAVLQDMGDGNGLLTKGALSNADSQLWKVTGTIDNYILTSKLGNSINLSNTRFTTSSSNSNTFKFISTSNSALSPAWELQRNGGDTGQAMNQVGGAGVDKKLGEWNLGDNNNSLNFILPVDLGLPNSPIISTTGNDIWYYIKFKTGESVLQDMGNGNNLLTKVALQDTDAQLWKVTGSVDNYMLTSKLGNNINFNSSRFKTSSNTSNSFKFISTPNSSLSPAWELQRNGGSTGQAMNQFGGAGANKQLGEWNIGDINNPVSFLLPSKFGFLPEKPAEITITSSNTPPAVPLSLWYKNPATVWMTSALPIGNGEFGAMIFGGVAQEEIQFNDKTLWSGDTSSYGSYQNFGSLFINTNNVTNASNYRRTLDIENAIADVTFESNGVEYKREYFSSSYDDVIVIRLSSSAASMIDIDLMLWDAHAAVPLYENNTISLDGKLSLLNFNTKVQVINEGGVLTTLGDKIKVKDADAVTIILRGKTNFSPDSPTYTFPKESLDGLVQNAVDAATQKSYNFLKSDHIADYKSLFDRVSLNLGVTNNSIPTDELLQSYNNGTQSNFLEMLYFQYGRYLMISSARGIDTPSNLQGIWNNLNNPPWHSDIHSNINVQMNYWLAENTNLSELHNTFLNYIYNEAIVHDKWQQNAVESGQTKGWTLYTENSIFSSNGGFMKNYVVANAWVTMHMWQHYRYTLDETFLLDKAYPVMKSCAEYWLERLVLDTDGTWVCPDEYSPEHGPGAEDGVAHAQQLVWDLFNSTIRAMNILGNSVAADAAFKTELEAKFANLDTGLAIDSDGHLREWKYSPRSVGQNEHRHNSHLIGLYPGNQISPLIDETIFNAAVTSLTARGDEGTGWSMGWKINLWARALDGDHAHTILSKALNYVQNTGNGGGVGGGVYENLLDAHPPFQIDGNFGATAGVAEMLLQSHTGTIQILPALPSVWDTGNVKGLRATGLFELDIDWSNNKATTVKLLSKSDNTCVMTYPLIKDAVVVNTITNQAINVTIISDSVISFPTNADTNYTISFNNGSLGINDKMFLTDNLYPNPFVDYLYANIGQTQSENASVRIHSVTGKLIQSTTLPINNGIVTINGSDFKTGIYILKVKTVEEDFNFKIIKK